MGFWRDLQEHTSAALIGCLPIPPKLHGFNGVNLPTQALISTAEGHTKPKPCMDVKSTQKFANTHTKKKHKKQIKTILTPVSKFSN